MGQRERDGVVVVVRATNGGKPGQGEERDERMEERQPHEGPRGASTHRQKPREREQRGSSLVYTYIYVRCPHHILSLSLCV